MKSHDLRQTALMYLNAAQAAFEEGDLAGALEILQAGRIWIETHA
jgi:hypothetical protein